VTVIPESFAKQYTGGRRMALGFGGAISIIQTASNGPALAAIKPDFDSGEINFQNIIYYPFPEGCIRDGNYFYAASQTNYLNPVSPWEGTWSNADWIGSGLFIDLPDKKGYVAFASQATGRIGYDYGGYNWNGTFQNVLYFYDFETLGQAATGMIPNNGVTPASIFLMEYPTDSTIKYQIAAGSCFDPETRLLYIYMTRVLYPSIPGGPDRQGEPVVHVYSVKKEM